jgi:SnoaL-like domain
MIDYLRAAIVRHFELIGQDNVASAEMYAADAVLEYVQSGERIRGRANIIASRDAYPGRPATFEVHRVVGGGDTRTAEITLRFDGTDPHPLVAVLDLHDDLIIRERIYIAEPWDPPEYRAQWVER